MANDSDALDRVIGGWRLSSVTSFQAGYPLALTAQGNDLSNSFGAAGSAQPCCRLQSQANRRSDSTFEQMVQHGLLCAAGAIYLRQRRSSDRICVAKASTIGSFRFKGYKITERVHMMFEGEFINAFNRVQFGPPGLQVGSSIFGVVTSTLNNPREIQFAARLLF